MSKSVVIYELDDKGDPIPPNLAETNTYNGDGTINTIVKTDNVYTWTKTFVYTSGKITTNPRWVRS